MAENLKSKEDENERKDKLEQMDSKLKYIKNLIIEEALRYANLEDEADLQKVALPTLNHINDQFHFWNTEIQLRTKLLQQEFSSNFSVSNLQIRNYPSFNDFNTNL